MPRLTFLLDPTRCARTFYWSVAENPAVLFGARSFAGSVGERASGATWVENMLGLDLVRLVGERLNDLGLGREARGQGASTAACALLGAAEEINFPRQLILRRLGNAQRCPLQSFRDRRFAAGKQAHRPTSLFFFFPTLGA